jgi:cytochrome c biogenesis protein CcdA
MEFLSFSFIQGVLAFLAPCAVALLPGYIVAFISRNSQQDLTIGVKVARGLKLAFLSIAGILTVYALAGGAIIVASHFLKMYMKWISIGMGGVLLIMGVLMVFGKSFSFSLHISEPNTKTESVEAYFFGVAYAVGALGCLFPLFLIVATQAMAAPNVLEGGSYFLAYFTGMSGMMILTILLSIFAKNLLMKYLRKILPSMERITGLLLIVAGIYVIQYQMALF